MSPTPTRPAPGQRHVALPQLDQPVLSTLNQDGSRRWMTPRLVKGRWWKARAIVGWGLIVLFAVLPWLRIGGRPPILLDVMARQFTFFGTVFRPTDTLLLALLFISLFVGIFLLTALVGRVWCGWACPQTVYMEFLYRPLERFFLGSAYGRRGAVVPVWRRILLYGAFLLASAHLANTFLAYFVGTDRLVEWTLGTPVRHPVAFTVFAATTGLMMFDFCFFREQLCTLVCPYGRFQSVLLDRNSLIVGYDRTRGEPRGRAAGPGPAPAGRGDCVDCTMCVQVCPTGIDIRNGLQLECVNCTQCIDACDAVMSRLGRPTGLIRYSSQRTLEGSPPPRVRVRLITYPAILVVLLGAFAWLLLTRATADVVQMRTPGVTFTVLPDGRVQAPLKVRIDNRTAETRRYRVHGPADALLEGPTEVEVGPWSSTDAAFTVLAPAASFTSGRRSVEISVSDGDRYSRTTSCQVLGPLATPPLRGARE